MSVLWCACAVLCGAGAAGLWEARTTYSVQSTLLLSEAGAAGRGRDAGWRLSAVLALEPRAADPAQDACLLRVTVSGAALSPTR